MTHDDRLESDAAEATIAHLQKEWILRWDKRPDQRLGSFRDVFADFYDFDAPAILFDDFDPERRVFRSPQEYADAFWPTFQQFRSAEHGFEVEPEVLVSGDLAATRMVFIAVLDPGDGSVLANRCTNSQVWRRSEALGWRIARDHTSVEAMDVDEARSFLTV